MEKLKCLVTNVKRRMNKNKITSLVFFFLLCVFMQTKAQVISIDAVLSAIQANYPMLQMYDAKIKALNAYSEGAKSWMSPQFGAGLFMYPYNGEKNMGAFMISGEQMIPNPLKLSANKKYMQSMSAVEQENKNLTENEMFSMAKMFYYDWVIMKRKKSVLNQNEDILNLMITSSENRYPFGQEKLNNIYKAKAQLYDLKNMQLMIDKDISQMMIALNTLMNRDKNIVFEVDTIFTIRNYEIELVDTSAIKSFRSDFKSTEKQISMMQFKKQLEKNQRLPDFGIRYDHMNTFGMPPNQFTVMGMITVPIAPWSSKMYKANVKGLDFEIASMQKQQENITNEVTGKLEELRTQLKFKKQQLILYSDSIIPALKKNYETTLLAYNQNTEELFIVLDAWQMLNMKQLEYLDRVNELLRIQIGYEKEIEKQ